MLLLTIDGHPEYEKGHAVEFSTPPYGESEATLPSSKLHCEVLVILSQMGVNLLVLLKKENNQIDQLISRFFDSSS